MNSNVEIKKYQRPLSSKVKKPNKLLKEQKNITSSLKKNNTGIIQNDFTSPSHHTSNFPSFDKNNRSKSVLNESNENIVESLNEEYSIIQRIWNTLGVTYKYKVLFDNYIKTCSETQLKNTFINEKKNLKRFGETLLKLTKEINTRENNIHSLRRYIISFVNNSNYLEDDENERIKYNRELAIKSIISLIKSLRLNSVNTVAHFLKVREILTYYVLVGKIDVKLISKEYKYDENYLNKMKNDMKFLNDFPQLSKYFDMNYTEIDPFLTNFAPKSSSNYNYSRINSHKVKIPVSDDLHKAIAQCRYVLLQENFFDNMKLFSENNSLLEIYKNNQTINNDINSNNISKASNNRFNNSKKTSNSKILFFKDDYNNNEMKPKNEISYIYSNNSLIKNIEDRDKKIVFGNNRYGSENMNRKLEFLRKNMSQDYNSLFMQNNDRIILKNKKKFMNNRIYNTNSNLNINNSEVLIRKPLGYNQIIIEREERNNMPKVEFQLDNNAINNKNENPLIEENEELNKQLDLVCEENEKLNDEIKKLKKYIISNKKKIEEENKERERIGIKKQKELDEKEKQNELKYKLLDKKKDDLIKEKNNLNQKLKETHTLMEKKNEENKQKINDMNKLMQKQKEENEQKIEKKNNEIKELNNLKDDIINEKNEIIRQKEQVINERDQLMEEKHNLEEKIKDLEAKIRDDEIEIEKYKQLQKDYQNLKDKENEMNKEIERLKEEIENLNQEKEKMINEANGQMDNLRDEKNQLEKNISFLNETIKNEQEEKEKLIKEKEDLLKEKESTTKQKDELINLNNNMKNQIKTLNNQINSLNNTLENLESKINVLKEDNNILQGRSPDDISMIVGKYIYDFYKGNLANFIQDISEPLSLDKIPDFLKLSFDLENINILDEGTYIKGVYPKIITSTLKSSKKITGLCSLYYENYGQDEEPLILRIEALCVLEQDWEEKIENFVNFIKEKMTFDEIKIIIKYMPNAEDENKMMLNQKIENLFKTKLNCTFKNSPNLEDGSDSQEIRINKYENECSQEDINYKNSKLFGFNTLSILSLYNSQNEEGETEEYDQIRLNVSINGYNRFINLLPIYLLLANHPTYKMIFANENDSKIYELPEDDENENIITKINPNPKNQIKKISDYICNINDISSLKEIINSSETLKNFDISNSLFEEVNAKLLEKNVDNISFNYFSMNVNLSTETNYCLAFENYYYNRISSKDIEILSDTEKKNLFYLIRTKTESTFLLISQVGRRLQKELLDGNKNIYQAFMEYHPKLTNQLQKFSLSKSQLKDTEKVIYIPSFKIDTHLFSFSVNDIKKKGTIIDEQSGEDGMVGSVEEYFKVSFEEDKDIKNSFSIIPVEDNKTNMVIREPFLFAVFNIKIFSNIPLQLFYVTQDHWIKVNKNNENKTDM